MASAMDKHATWCYSCGAKLKVIESVWSYDEYTGAENIAYDYICPNQPKWWKFWKLHPKTRDEVHVNLAP